MGGSSAKTESHDICVDPIFVFGAARSGTNILARSLARHPHLWTSGESHFLFSLFGAGKADAAFDSSLEASPLNWLKKNEVERAEFLRSMGIGISALLTSRSGGKRWIDHTPHYVLMADTLADMFPEAKFLHILRDGRRVVHSMTNFATRPNAKRESASKLPAWASDFREACRIWTRNVDAGVRFERRLPERCLAVLNEDLVRIPEETFARIYDFIGVPEHPAPIRFTRNRRLNSSFPPEPEGPPLLSEPWTEWGKEQRSIFAEVSGDTLIRCGFTSTEELASWQTGDAQGPVPASSEGD